MKKKLLFAVGRALRAKLFSPPDEDRIARACEEIADETPQQADKAFLLGHVAEAEVIVTSWGTAALDDDVMAGARKLKLLAHAAGSVKPVVTEALWERGVRVTSAAAAIAYGVSEFCLGLILTACKRALWAGVGVRQGQWAESLQVFGGPFEIYRQKIGIIGAGHVGRMLIRLLNNFECEVLLYDPYCPAEQASELGAQKVDTLEELFSRCMVVSLCAPNTAETHHMIRGEHFRLLPPGALFINTARGAIIHEREMIEELEKGRFVACLDVTEQEPPAPGHPLRELPNVWLTPHEAGAVAQNLLRIGAFVADEVEAHAAGRPLKYEVKQEQLSHIA